VSDGWLCIVTDDDRRRVHAARRDAGVCGACGRTLGVMETVYVERFETVRSRLSAPVGKECASHELLASTGGAEPERCVGCGRGVYYRLEYPSRRQATCSKRCTNRAAAARAARGRREA
jgi:hypothetical protein